jgi:hypothetical protein
VRIIFAGDFFYKKGKEPIITHEKIKKAITGCSAFILNLEGPIVNENPAFIQKVGPVMHQSERAINILETMGITAVTLANNHIMDGDWGGIQSTLSILNTSNIKFFGFEDTFLSIEKPLIRLNSDDRALSIISAAEEEFNGPLEFGGGAMIIDPITLWRLVTGELQQERDVVVVLHGGVEYEHFPPPWMREISHWLIDLGVTAVITHHPHVPGYVETYKDKPIAWSLGNFCFPSGIDADFWTRVGYVFELCFNRGTVHWNIYPYYSDYENGSIRELEQEEMDRWNTHITYFQDILRDKKAYEQWWNDLIEKKHQIYQRKYSLIPCFAIVNSVRRLFSRSQYKNRWRLHQLNGLRCRSHREIWIQSLLKLRYNEENDAGIRREQDR